MMKALYSLLFGNLRGRLIVGIATVQTVMMLLFISDLTMRQRTMLLSHQEEHAIALSQTLATSAAGWLAANDIAGLQELVEAQRRYPGLIFAMLTDNRGHVLADTDRSRQGMFLLDLPQEAKQFVFFKTADRVDVATPALVGGQQVGWARVGIGPKTFGKNLATISRNGIFYALAATLAGSVIAWLLGSLVTRRLYAIQETLNRVRAGEHQARATLTGSDEAAVMAQEFNAMLDAVAERDKKLQDSNMLLQKELLERKLTDEALQREKTLLRCIIDSASDLIFIKDLNGAYLGCNKASEELIGLPESAQLGKTDFDFFDREKAEQIRSNDQEVLSSKRPIRIEEWQDFPNGRRILLDTQKVPFYGPDGEIQGLVGVCRDITERKRAEEAILEAQQVFRALVENSPDIIARYDRNCQRTYVNPTYLKATQLPAKELLATAPVQLSPLPESSAAVLQDLLRRVLHSGIGDSIDVIWPKTDGKDYWYNIKAYPEYDSNGEIISVMTVSRDITERKRAEADLRTLNEELELRVKERTAELEHKNKELEKLNKIFIGRELRMAELKERIAELETGSSEQGRQNAEQG